MAAAQAPTPRGDVQIERRTAMRFTQKLSAAAAAAVLLVSGTVAPAGVTTVNLSSEGGKSVRNQGHYLGTATYDDDAGKLMITLQNTSQRGFITGLAFDIAGAATAGYANTDDVATTTLNENLFSDARGKKQGKAVKTRAFGKRETGTAINGKLRRRKGTKHGVAIGQSRTFEFDLTSTRAAGLNALSVFGDHSSLVVAFGGLKHKRRDIVTGGMTLLASSDDSEPSFDPIPSPGPTDKTTPGNEPTDTLLAGGDMTNPDGDNTNPGGDGGTIPGGTIPGGDNAAPHAVPLPTSAWAALATMGLLALNGARRRLFAGHE
jgi:hypothetical protein